MNPRNGKACKLEEGFIPEENKRKDSVSGAVNTLRNTAKTFFFY